MLILIMGISGVGKSTVGRMLADALNVRFIEGDDFHPASNRMKMASGQPLDDNDRAPWFAAIKAELDISQNRKETVVLACSALAQRYRDTLVKGCADARVIWLNGPPEVIRARMAARQDHFMPASLIDSQLATLEPPAGAVIADITLPPETIVSNVLRILRSGLIS